MPYHVNGKRSEISFKRYVSVNEWDEKKGGLHHKMHTKVKVIGN